jgi:hypothetical protein
MYLRGFSAWEGLSTLDRQQAEQCAAKGGTPIIRTRYVPSANALPGYMTGSEQPYFAGCQLPAAPSGGGAQINVSVPTNVNTQVSPQISPAFVQQDQPQNSPVSTATSANPQQSNSGAEFQEYLQQMENNRAASEARILETLQRQAVSTPQPVYAPITPVSDNMPETLPETVNKNIVPLAVAGAALLSIVAFFRSKKRS